MLNVVEKNFIKMDHKKSAKYTKPTIKLSDLNVTPVFIAILVVLISIGKTLIWLLSKDLSLLKSSFVCVHISLIDSGRSSLFSVEKEISKAHRSSADWTMRIRQNAHLLSIGEQWSPWNVHLNRWKYRRICDREQWRRASRNRYSGQWTIARPILRPIQNDGEGCDFSYRQCDCSKGYSRCGWVRSFHIFFGLSQTVFDMIFVQLTAICTPFWPIRA